MNAVCCLCGEKHWLAERVAGFTLQHSLIVAIVARSLSTRHRNHCYPSALLLQIKLLKQARHFRRHIRRYNSCVEVNYIPLFPWAAWYLSAGPSLAISKHRHRTASRCSLHSILLSLTSCVTTFTRAFVSNIPSRPDGRGDVLKDNLRRISMRQFVSTTRSTPHGQWSLYS